MAIAQSRAVDNCNNEEITKKKIFADLKNLLRPFLDPSKTLPGTLSRPF
jgi:hypothetical protein